MQNAEGRRQKAEGRRLSAEWSEQSPERVQRGEVRVAGVARTDWVSHRQSHPLFERAESGIVPERHELGVLAQKDERSGSGIERLLQPLEGGIRVAKPGMHARHV